MRRAIRILPVFAFILAIAFGAFRVFTAPQTPGDTRDRSVDAATRTAVIDAALKTLNEQYVFADVAKKMEAAVRDRVSRGEYNSITSGRGLAEKLQADLRDVSHDKHLRVLFSYEPIREGEDRGPSADEQARQRRQGEVANYGFEKVERLAGNVGYLDLRGFADSTEAQAAAAAAMNFLARSDALIVDLRRNGGGSPRMIVFLCSYLFGLEPVHLNDLYWRAPDRTDEFWTLKDIPGQRLGPGKPVYVLTSKRTFSAAEEFTYDLQSLKRATIVGETTGGGAHPGGTVRIHDHFRVWVPRGRAINPVTKKNWEGTGVTPDVSVSPALALKTAHQLALSKILESNKEDWRAEGLRDALAQVQRELDDLKKQPAGN